MGTGVAPGTGEAEKSEERRLILFPAVLVSANLAQGIGAECRPRPESNRAPRLSRRGTGIHRQGRTFGDGFRAARRVRKHPPGADEGRAALKAARFL